MNSDNKSKKLDKKSYMSDGKLDAVSALQQIFDEECAKAVLKGIITQKELEARALIAGDLFQEGEVTRIEAFRVAVDALLGKNTGDLKFEKNTDFEDGTM